jgi:GTP cyclohydrolase II
VDRRDPPRTQLLLLMLLLLLDVAVVASVDGGRSHASRDALCRVHLEVLVHDGLQPERPACLATLMSQQERLDARAAQITSSEALARGSMDLRVRECRAHALDVADEDAALAAVEGEV